MRWCSALVVLLSSFCFAQYPGAKAVPEAWKKGFSTISSADAKSILITLAGPTFKGRGPEQPGFAGAAGWCAAWLQANGIAPAGDDGGYFQVFTMQKREPSPQGASIASADGKTKLAFLKDFIWTLDGDLDTTYELVFVRAPKGDVEGLSLAAAKGRVVIVSSDTIRDNVLAITQKAAQAGAVVTAVADERESDFVPGSATVIAELSEGKPPLASLRIKGDAARSLARVCKADAFLAEKVDGPTLSAGGPAFSFTGKITKTDLYRSLNVLGKIEGSDPVLKKQAIVIGSHLDHLGISARGIFWGADDNGSGCTANLLIARAIAHNPVKPKRSVIFGFWALEERGLWGSLYYSERPAMPIADTVAYLNMDMVGRNAEYPNWGDRAEDNTDSVYVAAARLNSPDLYALLQKANAYVNLHLKDEKEDRTFRSDTGNFAGKGVPTLKAWTGEHPDYHKITDTPDKVNYVKLANVAKWLYLATEDLASSSAKPKFEAGALYLTGKVTMENPPALSTKAWVTLQLVDTTTSAVLDKITYRRPGLFPLFFALKYRTDALRPDHKYAISVEVVDGTSRYSTPPFPVLGTGQPTTRLEIPVKR